VIAQIHADMVKPRDDRPYEGFLLINSEISPMASSVYERDRYVLSVSECQSQRTDDSASDDEVMITRLLEKSIRRTEAVDREALCILAGEKVCLKLVSGEILIGQVWQLRLTIHFLNDGGNMLDCASLAAMCALRHFRKPDVEVIGDEIIVHSPDERAPIPLAIHHIPLCLTFAYFEE
jgi:exosome complex component RRP45